MARKLATAIKDIGTATQAIHIIGDFGYDGEDSPAQAQKDFDNGDSTTAVFTQTIDGGTATT
jgi:hypothetical protein